MKTIVTIHERNVEKEYPNIKNCELFDVTGFFYEKRVVLFINS